MVKMKEHLDSYELYTDSPAGTWAFGIVPVRKTDENNVAI